LSSQSLRRAEFLGRHVRLVKLPNKLFWIGILLYTFSFLLQATWSGPPGSSSMPGFVCAFLSFIGPLIEARDVLFRNLPSSLEPLAILSLLISGWINPVFALTMFLELAEQHERTAAILKIALLLMMPFTAIFFVAFGVFPREGYFLWLVAMLLALFSERFSGIVATKNASA
jgi:hypothetical protein